MGVFALWLSSVTPVGIYNIEITPTGVTEDNFLYLKFV